MKNELKKGVYRHYKGGLYRGLGEAVYSSSTSGHFIGEAVYSGTEGMPIFKRDLRTIRIYEKSDGNLVWQPKYPEHEITKEEKRETFMIYQPLKEGAFTAWRTTKEFFEQIREPEWNYEGSRFRLV